MSADCAEHVTVNAQLIAAPVFFGPPASRAVAAETHTIVALATRITSALAVFAAEAEISAVETRIRSAAADTVEDADALADALWTRRPDAVAADAAETAAAASNTWMTP